MKRTDTFISLEYALLKEIFPTIPDYQDYKLVCTPDSTQVMEMC